LNFSSLSHMRYLCLLGWVYFWALYLDPTRECLKPINPLIYIGEVRDSCRIHLQTLFFFFFSPFFLGGWPWPMNISMREATSLGVMETHCKKVALGLVMWSKDCSSTCYLIFLIFFNLFEASWSSWLIPSMILLLRHILLDLA